MTIKTKAASLLLLILLPLQAFAANGTTYTPMENIPGFESEKTDLATYIVTIYKFGIWTIGIAALLMITLGGIMYVTSAGNNSSMGKAKGIISDALIGVIMALSSWLILYTINPDLLKVKLPDASMGVSGSAGQLGVGNSDGSTGSNGSTGGSGSNGSGGSASGSASSGGSTSASSSSASNSSNSSSSNSSGQCNPTNNGCGGLAVNGETQSANGCAYTSSELASKLACLKSKGVSATVSSITKNTNSQWCSQCVWSYSGGVSGCSHTQNSCHFGGRNCKGTSQAADLVGSSMNSIVSAANSCGFDYVLNEGNHVHVSVNNAQCGCH